MGVQFSRSPKYHNRFRRYQDRLSTVSHTLDCVASLLIKDHVNTMVLVLDSMCPVAKAGYRKLLESPSEVQLNICNYVCIYSVHMQIILCTSRDRVYPVLEIDLISLYIFLPLTNTWRCMIIQSEARDEGMRPRIGVELVIISVSQADMM